MMQWMKIIPLLLLLAACSRQEATPTPTTAPAAPSGIPPLSERVKFIPEGFDIQVYGGIAKMGSSSFTFGPDAYLYILTVDGQIFRLRDDLKDDHFADARDLLYANETQVLDHAVGLAFAPDGTLYVSDKGRIVRMLDIDSDGIYDSIDPIVTGLPALLYPLHSNNGIAFGPDGKLYVGIGSTTDHGPIKERWEASILRMNPDGTELEVFATGFRNPYDLAFSPSGDLFTADNGSDQLDMTLRYLPPEELNHVRQGRNYGFPDVFGKMLPQGTTSEPPITEFFPSTVSAGLVYYGANLFPPAFRNGVFVAQFGTGVPAIIDRGIDQGHTVVFVPLQPTIEGTYTGDFQLFLQFLPDWGRPIDVTVGPDGALYVLEYLTGEVYRVSYVLAG